MKRVLGVIAGATLAVAAASGVAQAQSMDAARSINFGIAGGAAAPVGDRLDGYDVGYNIMGTLGFQPAAMPVGFRLGVQYQSLGANAGDDLKLFGADANAILTIANNAGIKPYLTGGVGLYNLDAGNGSDSQTKFALNGGGGLQFPMSGFNTYVEVRWNTIFTEDAASYIPIVFGITF
ncbi:MAG TPA: outer membrane beta-barrel protein [Gemmatimonadaceae bacterium]|nr:outer membrane beta-barrel protein [Gemmatimonadaceae bacterium]